MVSLSPDPGLLQTGLCNNMLRFSRFFRTDGPGTTKDLQGFQRVTFIVLELYCYDPELLC